MSIHVKNPKSTFIHIPKTGGESISDWMQAMHGTTFKPGEKHYTYSQMKSRYKNLGFTWTVVRNPWDRIVSGYHYYKRKDARILRQKKRPIESFEQFLKYENFGKTLEIPQSKFVPAHVDYVVRFENYENDFKQIQKFYNKRNPLPHKNKSTHTHYSEYYTEQWMIDVIERRFGEEIKRYNYDFTYK